LRPLKQRVKIKAEKRKGGHVAEDPENRGKTGEKKHVGASRGARGE